MIIERNQEIPVLDHGYVKLVDFMGTDETIIDAARMSTKGGFIAWEPYDGHPDGDLGLLEFLWKNHHATPFEMCELAIEVQAPIFVFREWHRHRTQSYNEMSARYTQMPNLHYVPSAMRIQKQSKKNKQGSAESFSTEEAELIIQGLEDDQIRVYNRYEIDLAKGVAKEVARINTPVARYSKMRAKTDLRNWLAFLNLRKRESAQWEIHQFADVVADIIKQLWPRTWALFEEYTLYSQTFSRTEMVALVDAINRMGIGAEELGSAARAAGMKAKHVKELFSKLKIV